MKMLAGILMAIAIAGCVELEPREEDRESAEKLDELMMEYAPGTTWEEYYAAATVYQDGDVYISTTIGNGGYQKNRDFAKKLCSRMANTAEIASGELDLEIDKIEVRTSTGTPIHWRSVPSEHVLQYE